MTPLLDAGLTKDDVRRASRRWGLPTWDKPAAACLSSRVAYGIEVTPHRLARVERAEAAVRAALAEPGLEGRDLRVRDLGGAGQRSRSTPRPARGPLSDGRSGARTCVLAAVLAAGFAEADDRPPRLPVRLAQRGRSTARVSGCRSAG